MLKKNSSHLLIAAALIFCCAGQQPHVAVIRIKGSDTMHLLLQQWVDRYMLSHPGVSVYLEAGGTETGFRALGSGQADVCAASRPMRAGEAKDLARKYSSVGMAHMVAKDALVVYVHQSNPVQHYALEQIQSIFTGRITRWSQIGGEDRPIEVLIRPPASGTHLYFAQHVLDGQSYRSDARVLTTNRAIIDEVMNNPAAISYGGSALAHDVAVCSIDGFAPTQEHVADGRYPLIRYLYLYTANTPVGATREFLTWVTSDAGQQIVKEMGYYPVWQ